MGQGRRLVRVRGVKGTTRNPPNQLAWPIGPYRDCTANQGACMRLVISFYAWENVALSLLFPHCSFYIILVCI